MRMFWVVSLGLIALLSACSSGATPAGPAATPAPTLDGTSWTVTAINGAAPITGNEPTMEFSADTVSGLASCNRYNAAYTQDVTKVTITPGIMTQMACAEDVMAQEQAFTEALTQVTGVRTAGDDGAELFGSDDTAVLTLARVTDKPLEGTEWTLTGIISGEAVASPVAESTVTLTISDGQLSGKACNSFHGDVTAADGSFTVGPLASTRMSCGSEELDKQEYTVLGTLQAATGYTIQGNELTITADDGTGLVFAAG
ncbi:MAG: META domain-containing protein [Propionibacteriaceae bacterium]|nr:META domain-containing protein [Propionibacteriaceae bacterium]